MPHSLELKDFFRPTKIRSCQLHLNSKASLKTGNERQTLLTLASSTPFLLTYRTYIGKLIVPVILCNQFDFDCEDFRTYRVNCAVNLKAVLPLKGSNIGNIDNSRSQQAMHEKVSHLVEQMLYFRFSCSSYLHDFDHTKKFFACSS